MEHIEDPPGTVLSWIGRGLAKDTLLNEAESLYWGALKLELTAAACSLNSMLSQDPPLEELSVDSREFLPRQKRLSLRVLPYIEAWWPFKDRDDAHEHDIDVLRKTLLGESEHRGVQDHQDKPVEYRLARMILCGLGILDIDKIIEYRNPQFPSLCGPPQLGVFDDRVEHLKNDRMDVQFIFLTCNDCGKVIRAAYYECSEGCKHQDYEETKEVFAVCAKCYETTTHEFRHLAKRSLHNPFSESVAKELCQCPGVINPLRVVIELPDSDRWETLFEDRAKQRRTLEGHTSKCQFLAMESKRHAVIDAVNEQEDREYEEKLKAKLKSQNRPYRSRLDKRIIKLFPDQVQSRLFPIGNAHISLMLGPLIIENGAEPDLEGVVISCRNPPNLGIPYTAITEIGPTAADLHLNRVLSITGDKSRRLRETQWPPRSRRLNGSIKQCLGGVFSGHESTWSAAESSLITEFLQIAQSYRPGLSKQYNTEQIKKLLSGCDSIVALLKPIIGPMLHRYLELLLGKLWDPSVPLTWSREFNNCQAFCDRLVHQPALATVFPPAHPGLTEAANSLNYLLSFCSRLPSLSDDTDLITSRLNDYFRSFHHEYDIIASFEELGKADSGDPLSCKGLLLWDCTAASCSISEHIWQHVYDSTSILFFHILRRYESYTSENWPENINQPSAQSRESMRLSTRQWLRQRIAVLQGIDLLLGHCGALSRVFVEMGSQTYKVKSQTSIGLWKRHRPEKIKFIWGKWAPGNSDTAGRHGPELMAAYEDEEMLTLLRN